MSCPLERGARIGVMATRPLGATNVHGIPMRAPAVLSATQSRTSARVGVMATRPLGGKNVIGIQRRAPAVTLSARMRYRGITRIGPST